MNDEDDTPKYRKHVNDNSGSTVTRRRRKRSTGRTTQFTVKLKPETNNRIYEIADELNASAIAEVVEMAVQALDQKLKHVAKS